MKITFCLINPILGSITKTQDQIEKKNYSNFLENGANLNVITDMSIKKGKH